MLAFVATFVARNYLHQQYLHDGATAPTAERSVWSKGGGYGVRYITDDQNRNLQMLWYGHFGLLALGAGFEALLRRAEKERDAGNAA